MYRCIANFGESRRAFEISMTFSNQYGIVYSRNYCYVVNRRWDDYAKFIIAEVDTICLKLTQQT